MCDTKEYLNYLLYALKKYLCQLPHILLDLAIHDFLCENKTYITCFQSPINLRYTIILVIHWVHKFIIIAGSSGHYRKLLKNIESFITFFFLLCYWLIFFKEKNNWNIIFFILDILHSYQLNWFDSIILKKI